MENAQDDCIEALILQRMWYSRKCYKTETEVTTRLNSLSYKKDNLDMLKHHIQICVIAFGWEEFKTQWSKYARQK